MTNFTDAQADQALRKMDPLERVKLSSRILSEMAKDGRIDADTFIERFKIYQERLRKAVMEKTHPHSEEGEG